MKRDQISPICATTIPGYEVLPDLFFNKAAIRDFQRKQSCLAEIEGLWAELAQVYAMPPDSGEMQIELREHHKAYADHRIDVIEKAFFKNYTGGSPLKYVRNNNLNLALNIILPPRIELDEFLEAYRRAPKPKGITKVKRAKAIEKIEGKISKLEAEIDQLFPKIFRDRNRTDVRENFLKSWIDTQGKINAPAGPRGFCLTYSQPNEREAWKQLKIGDFIDRKNGKDPYDPRPDQP